MLNWRT